MRYVLTKIGLFLLTLWAAVTLNFILPRLMPGSPLDAALAKLAASGQQVTNAQKQAIEAQLGSPHGNIFSQYGQYLNDIVHLRFGQSFTDPTRTVAGSIGRALPWTLALVGVTTILAFVIGTLLGVYAGWRRGRKTDTVITVSATFFASFPAFWFGLLLLYVFAFKLNWFAIQGGYSDGLTPNWSFNFFSNAVQHSILPGLTLALTSLSGWVFGMRNNMVNTLGEDYVTFAEANGLKQHTIALRYAARNALLPNVTAFGLSLGAVLGGSVLVEGIFSYPGMGHLLFEAVSNRDFPLMQAIFLVLTVGMLTTIFIVDLLYARLDPRVRQ